MPAPYRIAERMKQLDASGIRKVFDLAAKMSNPINLSIGQPHFDVPDEVKSEAIAAIKKGFNKYTQTQGIAELRQAVAQIVKEEIGWDVAIEAEPSRDSKTCLITSGTSGALLLAFMVLINPGDEVILLDPYFVMYKHLVNLVGGKAVIVDTYPDFLPDPQRIADAMTERTKLMVINSPCNPTGQVYHADLLKEIAQLAAGRDLLIISDEIYNLFCYDTPFCSTASFYDDTLILRGFSKSYAMTGWRLGWCAGPADILEKMAMLQQYSFVCAPSPAQVAGVAALKCDMSEQVAQYRRKRDMVYQALAEPFGLIKPAGAFYAFVPAPKGMSGTDFVSLAIENNVLIIPGNVFSQKDTHFRLSYATSDEKLQEGLEILVKLAK